MTQPFHLSVSQFLCANANAIWVLPVFADKEATEKFDSMVGQISTAMVNKRIETNNISRTQWNLDSVRRKNEVE
jgi:hypothetical protein